MKFLIESTSHNSKYGFFDEDEEVPPPIAGAAQVTLTVEELSRLVKRRAWVIEINTLEELLHFQEQFGSIIIRDPIITIVGGEPRFIIEIYDDWRE